MNLIKNLELASDIMSLAHGQVPVSAGLRLIPIFFHRRKGLSKAQMKKMMMRRRRMFVDTVIMEHKRIHDKNREEIIERTKARLSGKPKTQIKLNTKTIATPLLVSSKKPERGPNRNDSKAKAGPTQEHRTKIQGLIDNNRQRSRSKWTTRVNENNGSSQSI